MRNSLPLLARAVHHHHQRDESPSFEVYTQTPPLPNPNIPAIRLVQATPSPDSSLAVPDQSVLAPKQLPSSPRGTKLVPKKSKLALLASRATSTSTREKDLSDVVRRVSARNDGQEGICNVTVNGGTMLGSEKNKAAHKHASSRSTIDIYVDPADDPEIGEIVVVKKKKSRAGLDNIRWALGEVTNAPEEAVPGKRKKDEIVKLKVEEKERWWSIGRGRHDSKSKEKEDKTTFGSSKFKLRPKVSSASAVPTLSKSKPAESQGQSRPRNHSLDSGLLLSVPTSSSVLHPPQSNPLASASTPHLTLATSLPAPQVTLTPSPTVDCFSANPDTQSHYSKQAAIARQRAGSTPGLLSPPDSGYADAFRIPRTSVDSVRPQGTGQTNGKGSIALRAMKSLARIGSWAQLRNTNPASAAAGKTSSSSFEVGALSSPGRGGDDTTGGLPSPNPTVNSTSNRNTGRFSTMAALGHGPPPILLKPISAATRRNGNQRVSSGSTATSMSLNVPSFHPRNHDTVARSMKLSAGSNESGEHTSSSGPGSTYTASGEDNTNTNTNVGTGTWGWGAGRKKSSVRWGGVVVGGGGDKGVKKEKESRKGKNKDKEETKNTKRSSGEGRRRTPVMSVFPQLTLAIRGSKAMPAPGGEPTSSSQPVQASAAPQEPALRPPSQAELDSARPVSQRVNEEYDDDDFDDDLDNEEACVRYAVRVPTFSRDTPRTSTAHTKLPSGGGSGLPVPAFVASAAQQARDGDVDVPPARPRPRPVSEQLLGGTKQRPKGIIGSTGTLGEDPQMLTLLEAANSDLASLINRLDLEATPDSKASRRVSYAYTASADPTMTSSFAGLGTGTGREATSTISLTSSLKAMERFVRGYGKDGADDSPLKKKLAALSSSVRNPNPSLTSLKPGIYKAQAQAPPPQPPLQVGKSGQNHERAQAQGATVLPAPPPRADNGPALIGKPIMPWSELLEQTERAIAEEERERERERREKEGKDTLEPLRAAQDPRQQLGLKRSSRELRSKAAPFMMTRTPSVSSTFGSGAVLAKLKNNSNAATPPEQNHPSTDEPTKYTFGVPPVRYRLPSLESMSSVTARGLGFGENADETPTRKGKTGAGGGAAGHGHRRQLSHIVPVKRVKEVVDSFEARTRREKEEASRTPPSSSEKRTRKRSTLDAATRRELGFKGTLGVHDDEELKTSSEEDSDIPDELKEVLSQSDKDETRPLSPVVAVPTEDMMSFVPPEQANNHLNGTTIRGLPASTAFPPSPGLPPAAPLPDPKDTPASTATTSPAMRASPPAPTMLLEFEPSLSPSRSSTAPLMTLTLPPPPRLTINALSGSSDRESNGEADNERASPSSDSEDTKQSFDFTGELARLNESGGAHRRSFVEQLEEAFKTPAPAARLGLGLGFGTFLSVVGSAGAAQSGSDEERRGMVNEEVKTRPSYGRLDMAFKFGGKPQQQAGREERKPAEDDSMALELPGVAALSTVESPSQVGPTDNGFNSLGLPHQRRRSLSTSAIEEDSSVLRSILAQAAEIRSSQAAQPHARTTKTSLESDTSSKRRARMSTASNAGGPPGPDARYSHVRNASDISFSGMSSFGAVRTRFEFGPNTSRPEYFEASVPSHGRHESLYSIASISSYGEIIKDGLKDPFQYGESGDHGADVDEKRDRVDALSSFEARRKKRFSTDSESSSFYFRGGHNRNQSVMSTASGPPISLYNRSFGHKRNDSAGSASSVALAYANGGWIKHKPDQSVDSTKSDNSALRLGRPGIGDKMFDHLFDHPPLSAISASPPESVIGSSNDLARKSSYDSILDEDRRSTFDSIFDGTGQRSSMSSDSVFGYEASSGPSLFPPTLFRPVSVISIHNPSSPHEDDTMITMLGGEHVRRRSIGSSFEASPCVRVEKRKHAELLEEQGKERARLMRQDSVASSASSTSAKLFGETRMSLARNGLLHRNSLEDSCLSAEGEEDLSVSLNASTRSSGFDRPLPTSRARRRPMVTISHPPDTTPPLSSSEGSQSGGSQSSIDVARLNVLLQAAVAGQTSSRVRARARGQGHRRRPSQMSRSSIIVDTIEEENPGLSHSPCPSVDIRSNRNSFDSAVSVESVKPEPQIEILEWDDETFTLGLRKYYALRNEADETIVQSRIVWPDTQFSLHAVQTFIPPKHPAGMQALLEHSQKTYITMPPEWRPRRIRSRTSSLNRPSPYPRVHRPTSSSGSSVKSRPSSVDGSFDRSRALQPLSPNNNMLKSPAPALGAITPFSPLAFDVTNKSKDSIEPVSVIKPAVRPRVGSAARRNALGWSKRKTPKATKMNEGKSFENKENEAHGLLTSPQESLRIVRPRPRSRRISATPLSKSLLA